MPLLFQRISVKDHRRPRRVARGVYDDAPNGAGPLRRFIDREDQRYPQPGRDVEGNRERYRYRHRAGKPWQRTDDGAEHRAADDDKNDIDVEYQPGGFKYLFHDAPPSNQQPGRQRDFHHSLKENPDQAEQDQKQQKVHKIDLLRHFSEVYRRQRKAAAVKPDECHRDEI